MKKMKRVLVLFMALVMLLAIAACGGEIEAAPETTPEATPEATPDTVPEEPPETIPDSGMYATPRPDWIPKDIPARDLGGIEIIIADWWTRSDAERAPPQNLREEQYEDFLYELEYEHGFTVKRMSVAGWGDYLELFTTSVMAGDPEADIYIMPPDWAVQLMKQGLLYPLNTLDSIDVFDPKWNQMITDAYTMSGNVYAISGERFVEPRNFMFFNKRLFEEAGIDPEEPYNLQAEGKWTWDVFEEYCKKLTRDINGDGITDIYALTGFESEIAHGFVYSNNARYIGINPDGTFYNAMSEPNFIEAMQFVKKLHEEGYSDTYGDERSWDFFINAFADGQAAMCFPIGTYQSEGWLSMDDDWGVVFPPMGPKAIDYNTFFSENVYCIPFNISKERAEDIAYAFHMFNQPLPYDIANPDYWKDGAWGYQRFKDRRAVDDTLAMFYEGRGEFNSKTYVTGVDWGPVYDWGCVHGDESVIEKIESAKPVVDAAVEEANKR